MRAGVDEEGELVITPETNLEKTFIREVLGCRYTGDSIKIFLHEDIFGEKYLTTEIR